MRSDCKRLFTVPPAAVFEHPPELPTDLESIPVGLIAGWECYGPDWDGDPARVVGPFDPVVVEEVSLYGPRRLYIQDNYRIYAENQYWFRNYNEPADEPRGPCWYQSGCTLRFVRKRKDVGTGSAGS